MISSFDIFDTCLVRKCGTPENFFDVFSLRAFEHEPPEWARQEFVAARRLTEQKLWAENPHYALQDIWAEMDWSHPFLKSKKELSELEQKLEQEELVPVLAMRDKVNECRKKGDKIIFISDMYLSSAFLVDVMHEHGFYQEGDSLYVSCECQAAKWNGELFRYVKEKEGLSSFRQWHHYGDNKLGDYKTPKKLGIKCTLIHHEYTPYQKQWKENDYSLGFKYPSILAGLGRALHYSTTEWNTHTDFVLDIIAPFYCSWMYMVLEDAQRNGIKRLYFCARDAYQIHKIALVMQPLFPEVGIEYVYMSRKALYNEENDAAKIAYYAQIGLATKTDKVAIVDTTTSGKTLVVLNEFLTAHGCKDVTAYYYLLWNKVEGVDRSKYHVQVYDEYLKTNDNCRFLLKELYLFENFFALNNDNKTIDYKDAQPVYTGQKEHDDYILTDKVDWAAIHEGIMTMYAKEYIRVGLGMYSSDLYRHIVMPTLCQFFRNPEKHYLQTLETYSIYKSNRNKFVPYVEKMPIWMLPFKRGKFSIWRRATFIYSLPDWFNKILYRYYKS